MSAMDNMLGYVEQFPREVLEGADVLYLTDGECDTSQCNRSRRHRQNMQRLHDEYGMRLFSLAIVPKSEQMRVKAQMEGMFDFFSMSSSEDLSDGIQQLFTAIVEHSVYEVGGESM